jgi:hypothetical protein
MCATLHAIHSIFQSPAANDPPGAKDPIFEKKLAKGDARWEPTKEGLGYEFNGKGRTCQLPQLKAESLLKELQKALRKWCLPLKRFRLLAGRLQHAARIIPAAKAFFTPINNALHGLPDFVGLGWHGNLQQALLDSGVLIMELSR